MGRSRERERYFQKKGKMAQAYGMGDVKVGQLTGAYPPEDFLKRDKQQ